MASSDDQPRLIFVIGCTGCGKGGLGRELARRTGGEIISIDSMKVYRRMDIGTAKPSEAVRAEIPHHLVDVVEPSEDFSVAQYVPLAEAAVAEIHARGRPIFVVGGTPLYVKGLTEGLFEGPGADPEIRARLHAEAEAGQLESLYRRLQTVDPIAAERIHPNDLRRVVRALEVYELVGKPISELQVQWDQQRRRYDCVFIGLRRDREDQNQRTNARARRMVEEGLVEEVQRLLDEPQPLSTTARQALGYAEVIEHLEGKCTLAEALEKIKINTRHLAKAQRTWFRRFADVHWIDLKPDDTAAGVANTLMQEPDAPWLPSPK
jgi:tRNA dimethylallyltransferase